MLTDHADGVDSADSEPAPRVERSSGSRAPWLGRVWSRDAAGWAVLVAASVLAQVYTLRLWRTSVWQPRTYAGDEHVYASLIDTILERGWWFSEPRLGAPYGQNHHDFPFSGDSVQVLLIRLLGVFTKDPIAVMNLHFWLGSVLIACAAYWVLRRLELPIPISIVIAVLYANLPYHFAHGTSHLFRSAYFAVPLVCLGLLWVLGARGGVVVDGTLRRRRVAFVLAAAALAGVTDTTTVAFPAALFGIAGLVLAGARRWKASGVALVAAVVAPLTLLIVNIPSFWYQRRVGANPNVLRRDPGDQEAYGLKLSRVLFPDDRHPVAFLSELGSAAVEQSRIPSESGQYIGLVAVIGLIWGVIVVLRAVISSPERVRPDDEVVLRAGLLAIVAIVVAVPSGFAFVLTALGGEEFRVWNRIVTYVAFFALLVAALLMADVYRRSWGRSGRPSRIGTVVALSVVLVVGLADQSGAYVPNYDASARRYRSDQEFYNNIEAAAPECAEVFNAPYNTAPESLTMNGRLFHQLVGTLFTDCVRFSYGAPRGRVASEWQANAVALPATLSINAILSVGYDGLLVERDDFTDRGTALLAFLDEALQVEPMASPLRDVVYYDTRPAYERLLATFGGDLADQMRTAVLEPVLVRFEEGFAQTGFHARAQMFDGGTIRLENTAGVDRTVGLMINRPVLGDMRALSIVDEGGTSLTELDTSGATVTVPVDVPAGGTTLTLVPVDGGPNAGALLGFATYDVVLEPLLAYGHPAVATPFAELSPR